MATGTKMAKTMNSNGSSTYVVTLNAQASKVSAYTHPWVPKQRASCTNTLTTMWDDDYTYGWDKAVAGRFFNEDVDGRLVVPLGQAARFVFPDGMEVRLDADGRIEVHTQTARRIYAANNHRDFNPYLNASDLLARFVEFLGILGVRQRDMASIPLPLFINWLVIEAAAADGDPVPAGVSLPLLPKPRTAVQFKPRCQVCQRFIPHVFGKRGFLWCGPQHAAVGLP